jgi:predicted phosphodiesterase
MEVLLISDVHANLPALDAVLNQASYDEVLFMGDAVDYGPFPFEVYSRLKQIRATRVLGNHDAAASFGIDCQSSPQMHEASVLTREKITVRRMPRRALQALGKAERRMFMDYDGLGVMTLHASPADELYQYVSKEDAANLEVRGTDLLVVGHTHIPYEVNNGSTWIVNPGSVGMPKDGDPRASYAILDTYDRKVRFERAAYDTEPMLSKLHQLLHEETRIYELLADVFRTGRQ